MKILAITTFALFALNSYAQVDPIGKNGVAIGGYDVVAYHVSQKPVKGSESISAQHAGVRYYFSTSDNRELFNENPKKYLPQFDPETFKVKDEKLYLFFHGRTSTGKVNSIDTWNKNEARLLNKANTNWPDVMKKKYKPEDTF